LTIGLPVRRVTAGEPFERVQPGEPDRRLVAPELVGGLAVDLGDPAFGGVVVLLHEVQLGRPLPPCGEQLGGGAPGTDDDVGGGLQRVQPRGVLGAAAAEQGEQQRRGDARHDQQPGSPEQDRPRAQHPRLGPHGVILPGVVLPWSRSALRPGPQAALW
jgi:hypothetical protein